MRLIDKIGLTYGALFVLAFLCAGICIWSAIQAEYNLKRAHLAHRTYEQHMRLSNHTYQLLKQYADALLIGDRDSGRGERALAREIGADIESIRRLIDKESVLSGTSEDSEHASISALEQSINGILSEYENYISEVKKAGRVPSLDRLVEILDFSVDEEFNRQIETALRHELREVEEAIVYNDQMMGLFRRTAVFFGGAALLVTIGSLVLILKSVRQPIRQLNIGAQKFAQGHWDYRIQTKTTGELKEIGDVLNNTAKAAREREQALTEAKERLEDEVRQRTSELRDALLTLEEQAANRRKLLADVSHELRTPLTIIRGEADIALRGDEKTIDEYKEALRRTRSAAEHTGALVNDVLFIARQEAGKNRLELSHCDLVLLVKQTLHAMASVIADRGVHLKYDLFDGATPIYADANRIRQVLLVLFENACQYGGNEIEVAVRPLTEGYQLSISDNGPGIPDDEQNKIFERFFRGSNAAERYGAGTGLGLPVAKSVVEAHFGEICLRSKLGAGTTFIVTLPRTPIED